MSINVRVPLVLAAIVSACLPNAALCQTSPLPAGAASTASTAATTGQAAPTTPQPAPAGFLEQEALTGEWGGARTRWKDKGVVLDSSHAVLSRRE